MKWFAPFAAGKDVVERRAGGRRFSSSLDVGIYPSWLRRWKCESRFRLAPPPQSDERRRPGHGRHSAGSSER